MEDEIQTSFCCLKEENAEEAKESDPTFLISKSKVSPER